VKNNKKNSACRKKGVSLLGGKDGNNSGALLLA